MTNQLSLGLPEEPAPPREEITIPMEIPEFEDTPGTTLPIPMFFPLGDVTISGVKMEGGLILMGEPGEPEIAYIDPMPKETGYHNGIPGDPYYHTDKLMIQYLVKWCNIWESGWERHWKQFKDPDEVRQKIRSIRDDPNDPASSLNEWQPVYFTHTVLSRNPNKFSLVFDAFMNNKPRFNERRNR